MDLFFVRLIDYMYVDLFYLMYIVIYIEVCEYDFFKEYLLIYIYVCLFFFD